MKKIILTTLAIALMSGAFAQENGQFSIGARFGGALGFNQTLSFGPWAGQNLMNTNVMYFSRESAGNFNFALFGNYTFNNRLALQAEFNFMIKQGYEIRIASPGMQTMWLDVDYSSMDIPILLQLNVLNSESRSRFGIQAGPLVSIPLGRLEVYDNRAEAYIDKFDITTSATFGATAGIFGRFPVGPGHIVTDLRFIFDFSSVEAEMGIFAPYSFPLPVMDRLSLIFTVGYQISF